MKNQDEKWIIELIDSKKIKKVIGKPNSKFSNFEFYEINSNNVINKGILLAVFKDKYRHYNDSKSRWSLAYLKNEKLGIWGDLCILGQEKINDIIGKKIESKWDSNNKKTFETPLEWIKQF